MLIIDAFNVLHTQGVLPPDLADPGVPGLIRLIASSRYARRDLTIVCDGSGGSGTSGVRMDRAHVLYSGAGREADDLIEDLIDRFHRSNPLIVVSSDARLRKAARRRRCERIGSETFLKHLANDAGRPTAARDPQILRAQVPLDAYSVDTWLREFGIATPDRSPDRSPDPVLDAIPEPSNPTGLKPTAPTQQDRNRRKPKKPKRTTTRHPGLLGEPLRIELPEPAPESMTQPEARTLPEPVEIQTAATDSKQSAPQRPSPEADSGTLDNLDPLLLEALQEWRDRLTIDDLDMQRWIPDATPLPTTKRRGPRRPEG